MYEHVYNTTSFSTFYPQNTVYEWVMYQEEVFTMSNEGRTLWLKTLSELKKLEPFVHAALYGADVDTFDGTNLQVAVPTPSILDHMTKSGNDTRVEQIVSAFHGSPVRLQFIVKRFTENSTPKTARTVESKNPFNPHYTFETFVVGERNRLAHAASIAVAERPGRGYNPFFLHGDVGLGKTHLMHAIAQRALQMNPTALITYITTETFVREYVTALQFNHVDEFRRRYRNVDILLIDDIQFISGKDSTQEEFFHTFNTLYSEQKQIVITSDRAPKEISDLEDRLRSRFSGGLIIDVKPPDLETRMAILRRKARAEGVDIPDDAIQVIASHIETNVRELEGALIRVIAYSSMMNKDIDAALTQTAISDLIPENQQNRSVTLTDIQKAVCTHFHIKMDDLRGRSRQKDIANPRQIAMYLTRELTDLSLPKIGHDFGGRDHTTVLHACEKIDKLLSTDPEIKRTIDHLKHTLTILTR